MTRISVHGSEGGFVLLDALFCLFTAALILLLISSSVSTVVSYSSKIIADGISIIEERNNNIGKSYEK